MAQLLQTLALLSVIPLSIPLGVHAHMEMSWPYPFRSKFDPAIVEPDYDNNFPLNSDGSNYPCRGYQNLASSQVPQVSYTPGQTYNITLAGTATHMGGSCQISLSYDDGQSFKVIRSMIGGCPLKADWDFTIPSDAPASDSVILAWTWFNLVGSREMYMNCARVSIAGQSVQRYRRYQSKRQSSFGGLPDVFTCNIGNGCTTIERREVVFPNPGPSVERGTDETTPDPGPGFVLDSTPPGDAFSSMVPNATASVTVTNDLSTSTSTSPTTTTFTGPAETGYSSVTYLNSTVLLTVNSSSTTTTAITTSTIPVVSPAFFYTANSTNTSIASTTTNNFTTAAPFINATITLTSVSTTSTTISTNGNITTFAPFANVSTTATTQSSNITLGTTTTSATPTAAFFISATNTTQFNSTPIASSSTLAPTTNPIVFVELSNTTSLTTNLSLSSTSITSTTRALTSVSSSTTTLISSTLSTTSSTVVTSFITVTTSTTSTAPTATIIPTICTPGTFACNSTTTFSQCVPGVSGSGTYVFMGSVAPGTQCVNGTFVRQNAGSCTPNGSLQCNGEVAFYICDQGGLINMGPVAPGTACRNGVIVLV